MSSVQPVVTTEVSPKARMTVEIPRTGDRLLFDLVTSVRMSESERLNLRSAFFSLWDMVTGFGDSKKPDKLR
ncbi:MAG: hypothetical protein H6595_08795 [Flavobacteriales bacterium]|nr:hypothetical protein [Flavobacteriales bacterium]MCB9167564.1 hypothetical protein [Flavobacteriales bacterium]